MDEITWLARILSRWQGTSCSPSWQSGHAILATWSWFARRPIWAMSTWSYRRGRALAVHIVAIGARHKFIKPHCLWQNGKVERLNRTLQGAWAYRQVFTTNAERSRRPPTLDRLLQPPTTPQRPRKPSTHQPPVTNLTAGYI